jgi:hypothetical protein
VVFTGCAAEQSDPDTVPDRTPPALAAPTSPSPEEVALEAYRGMWGVVVEGSHEGAVGHPRLEEYASGQALEFTSDMLQGVVATGEPAMDPEVIDSDLAGSPATVSVEDCIDDSGWLIVDTATDGPSGPRLVTATVVSTDGQWFVDDLWMEDYGSC